MKRMLTGTMVVVLSMWLAGCVNAQLTRDQLGRDVKLKILVDKVMQPTASWHTEEWMVKAAAEAGFNVWSPRHGHNNFEEIALVNEWCAKYGIFHMPWMRGTLQVAEGQDATGKMMVWHTGGEQPLWSPNSDEFWAWTTNLIVEYAKLSGAGEPLMGVFLDYENYAPGPRLSGTLYSLSYDDLVMGMFAEAKGIELPELELAARKPWLDEQELHDEFEAFQIAHWRDRCRTLREAVDEYDPSFQFCIYPAPGTEFILQAALPEWTSEIAPVIMADAVTYGRITRFRPQPGALAEGRDKLGQRMQSVVDLGFPVIYTGGIDPVVRGADPEYSGKNAVMISDVTDGYWIFYEGPKYDTTHPDYWQWFTWANTAIDEANWAAQHEPRETYDPWAFKLASGEGAERTLLFPEVSGEVMELEPVQLRRGNLVVVPGKAGQPVRISAVARKIGASELPITWDVRDLAWEQLAEGSVAFGAPGDIEFTPPEDGVYLLSLSAGGSAYRFISADAPLGLYATEGISLIGDQPPLYFHVPAGVEEFSLSVKGGGAETVRLDVYDPDGVMVATGQTTKAVARATVEVQVGEHADAIWSLDIEKADEGVLEDVFLKLDPQVAPTLSFSPEQVFRLTQ